MTTKNNTSKTTKTVKSCKSKTTCMKIAPAVKSTKFLAREVKIKNVTYYFASDLIKSFGRGFLNLLSSDIKKARIKDNNNSQMRRLVKATDFNKIANKLKKSASVNK